jgi:hypothetical protein
MSLHVGALWVGSTERDRIVGLIREYWAQRGAQPITTDPLAVPPSALAKTGQLAFGVAPPAAVGPDSPQWTAVYDSERYRADNELAVHLAEQLRVPVVVAEFTGSVDTATIAVFGEGGPAVPRSGHPEHWDAVETFVREELPYAFIAFDQLQLAEPAALADWAVLGFEGVPFRRGAQYTGPSPDELATRQASARAKALAAAGDVAGLRDLWEREPARRDTLIGELDRDVTDETGRRVYLAFAEEILGREQYWLTYPLAEAAFLAGDEALFDRACASLGPRVSRLEAFGVGLLQQGRFDESVRVLSRVCAGKGPSLTSWNNLAHGLCYHNEPLPARTGQWLAAADEHGLANPYILHNTACAWLRIGHRDRALAAVESAVRAGYPLLDRLRTDDDLRALHDDPRFLAAFDRSAGPAHLSNLVLVVEHHGEPRVLARPLLTMHFFVEAGPGTSAGPTLAALMRAYLDDAPAGAVSTRRARGVWGKPLRPKRIAKDLARLRGAADSRWATIAYRGQTDADGGAPTPYGLDITLNGRTDPTDDPSETTVSTVRLLFPPDEAGTDPDAVVARFLRYAALAPLAAPLTASLAAGGCGLELVLRQSDQLEMWWQADMLRERREQLLGFEHHPGREWSPDTAPGPSWLTLVGPALVTRMSTMEGPRPLAVTGGLCLRASVYPPVGADPDDVGTLPSVARLLRPLRADGTPEHYARFDDLTDSGYDNTAATV